jgi:hypothetical protein
VAIQSLGRAAEVMAAAEVVAADVLFGTNLGIGVSVRVPFTESNLSVAGSVGSKELAIDTLPNYVEQKVADNNNFLNQSITLTI